MTSPAGPGGHLTEPLLTTKLMPPPLRADLVARPRLSALLGQALAHTLTLVVAPAGSGKTTLLATWVAALGARRAGAPPVAWLSLDEADDDPARFWRYLLAAVEREAPGLAAEAAALLHAGDARREPALTLLLNRLAADGRGLALVIDDAHLIRSPAIHAGIAFLADHAPPGLRLIIAGRSAPPLPLERLRVRRRLLELGTEELRFRGDEASALLTDSMGLDLSPAAVAGLVERTEGWAAGLVLAALAARGREQPEAYALSFGGASPLLLDYVTAEVLRGQPEELRRFLLATAALDRLCAELCNAVAGRDDSARLLALVERAGLFLLPLDDEGRWYRYHHLFAEAMRARAARAEPETLRVARVRAAAWFAARGLAAEAAGYALAAAAWEQAEALVAEAGAAALMRGETATLRSWLAALPPERIVAGGRLALLDGWLRVLAGDLAGAAERSRQAGASGVPAGQADELRALRAITGVMQGELADGLELAGLNPDRLPQSPFVAAVLAVARGLQAEFHGDPGAAAAAYAEAADVSEGGGSLLVSFIARCQLGEALLVSGRLRDAEASYRYADELARRDPDTARAVGGAAAIGLGAVALERGDYERAERLIAGALAGSMVLGGLAAIEAHTYLAQIDAARGAFADAAAHLDTAEALCRTSRFDALLPMVAAQRAQLDVRSGELGRAAAWLGAVEAAGVERMPDGLRELVDLGRAHVLIGLGRHDEALAMLDAVAAKAERAGRGRAFLESIIARAAALAGKGRAGAARAALDAARALAAQEGFVAILEGAGVVPAEAPALTSPASPTLRLHAGHALTERELEVLRLVAAGLGNDAIARRLVVAPGTVKKHINRIFAKLDAASRTQAVVRATAMGLLG